MVRTVVPSGAEARSFLRRLMRKIRRHWPRVEILIHADSHNCAPMVLDFCRAERVDFLLGVASTSCCRATANQFRLMLHSGACWLMWSLRLVKLATRVVALKSRVMLHLPRACPDKAILHFALARLSHLTC
ncbi:transposase [Roseococcus microcysteis]|uniref:transposase n=1 Tax=Roseococcus microcysteis TaxID=2771361 RepID=UPI00168A66EB